MKTPRITLQCLCLRTGQKWQCSNKRLFTFLKYRCPRVLCGTASTRYKTETETFMPLLYNFRSLHWVWNIARSTWGIRRPRLRARDWSVPVRPRRTTRGEGWAHRVPTAAEPHGARYVPFSFSVSLCSIYKWLLWYLSITLAALFPSQQCFESGVPSVHYTKENLYKECRLSGFYTTNAMRWCVSG